MRCAAPPCRRAAAAHIEETLSTLSYASRAKNIRNQPAVQVCGEGRGDRVGQ